MTKPDRQPLSGSERPRMASHKLLGPVDADELICVILLIRQRPGSPPIPDLEYWQRTPLGKRRFVTPDEFARTYGATQADLDAVTTFVFEYGMTVLEIHSGRRSVSVQGTVAQMNAAFGIQLNRYKGPMPRRHNTKQTQRNPCVSTHVHHGYDGPVHLPTGLAGIVIAVVGLDNRILGASSGSGDPSNATLLSVPQIAAHYNFPNSGAADQTIGVFAAQIIPGGGASYLATDITQYFQCLPAPYQKGPDGPYDINLTVGTKTYKNNPTVVQTIVAGFTDFNDYPFSEILELTCDISISATIAQGATVNVYFTEQSELGWVVFLLRVLVPEVGEKQPTVVTSSWFQYSTDDPNSLEGPGSICTIGTPAFVLSGLFQQLALLGINVFCIAGDWGADDAITDGKAHVSYPGSDPWVTSCGGTVVGDTEVVWSDAYSNSQFGSSTSDFGATGGGASANFPVPPYQTTANITEIKDSNGNTLSGMRFTPDIAGMVGYGSGSTTCESGNVQGMFCVNGISCYFVGTSGVAPLYAGLIAVLQSAFGEKFGFLNPTLYQLGTSSNTPFNDVTNGNNDSGDTPDSPYFTATTGWDPCTGWGSIDGTKFMNCIAGLKYKTTR